MGGILLHHAMTEALFRLDCTLESISTRFSRMLAEYTSFQVQRSKTYLTFLCLRDVGRGHMATYCIVHIQIRVKQRLSKLEGGGGAAAEAIEESGD